jgi:hypothetical protein
LAPEKSLGIASPLALGGRVIRDTFRRQIRGGRIIPRADGFEELGHDLLVLLGGRGRAVRGSGGRLLRGGEGWTEKRE